MMKLVFLISGAWAFYLGHRSRRGLDSLAKGGRALVASDLTTGIISHFNLMGEAEQGDTVAQPLCVALANGSVDRGPIPMYTPLSQALKRCRGFMLRRSLRVLKDLAEDEDAMIEHERRRQTLFYRWNFYRYWERPPFPSVDPSTLEESTSSDEDDSDKVDRARKWFGNVPERATEEYWGRWKGYRLDYGKTDVARPRNDGVVPDIPDAVKIRALAFYIEQCEDLKGRMDFAKLARAAVGRNVSPSQLPQALDELINDAEHLAISLPLEYEQRIDSLIDALKKGRKEAMNTLGTLTREEARLNYAFYYELLKDLEERFHFDQADAASRAAGNLLGLPAFSTLPSRQRTEESSPEVISASTPVSADLDAAISPPAEPTSLASETLPVINNENIAPATDSPDVVSAGHPLEEDSVTAPGESEVDVNSGDRMLGSTSADVSGTEPSRAEEEDQPPAEAETKDGESDVSWVLSKGEETPGESDERDETEADVADPTLSLEERLREPAGAEKIEAELQEKDQMADIATEPVLDTLSTTTELANSERIEQKTSGDSLTSAADD